MKLKKNVLCGLTFTFAALLSTSVIAASMMERYSSTLDYYFGEQSSTTISDGDNTYKSFLPPSDVLKEDGTTDSHALIQKIIDAGIKEGAESTVLLKNTNNALPIKANGGAKPKVTLLGYRSHISLLGAGMGPMASGPVINLETALSQNKTTFQDANSIAKGSADTYKDLDNFDFEGADFEINQTMVDTYQTMHTNRKGSQRYTMNQSPANKNYDPNEATLAELSAANPNYQASFSSYNDAAIVVIGRPSAENTDYIPGAVKATTGASEPLALTTTEKDILNLAKENFSNVIVLINSTNPIEIDELKHDDKISAIAWIGFPGNYGMAGVAQVLAGKVNPSGGLADTYASYNLSSPAMVNYGDYTFSNSESLTRSTKSSKYVVEAEGIYTGYKYYETRYYDTIVNPTSNATDATGAYASSSEWDYRKEVTYPFGYGLSYTTFSQKFVGEPKVIRKAHEFTMTFKVQVKNTGDVDGKAKIEIYGQAPYKKGGVEKAAIQLLEYEKTDVLKPGEEKTYEVKVDLQNIASWDSNVINEDNSQGCYILDAGDYYFSVGNGAHEALNNILALQGQTSSLIDEEGNSEAAHKYSYDANGKSVDASTFFITKADEKVKNEIPYADYNYYASSSDEKVTYLSRSDWKGTWPKEYKDLAAPSKMIADLNGLGENYYQVKTEDNTSSIKWSDEDTSYKLYELAGSDYDDLRWNDMLDQLSLEESMYLAAFGGPVFPGAESIGLIEGKFAENCGNGVGSTFSGTQDQNAPWSITDNNANYHCEVFASAPNYASTFNHDLQYEIGEIVGIESLYTGIPVLWGPGLNTHRQAYNGRTAEYYSEDGVLTGNCGMEFAIGALKYGLVTAAKHYAFNDQETNRNGIAPFMTEQKARENELRGYQIAVEATKYDTESKDVGMIGVMTSYSKVGAVECTSSYGMITGILKGEWGFHGYIVTDLIDDMDLFSSVVYSGVTGIDTRGTQGYGSSTTLAYLGVQADGSTISKDSFANDLTLQKALKESNHNMLWALSQSNLMNRFDASTKKIQLMTKWRAAYITLLSVNGVITIAMATLYIVCVLKNKEEE